MNKFECHYHVKQPTTIIDALQAQCDLTIGEIKKAIDKGALWHNRGKTTQRCRRLKKKLIIDDKLHFYYDPNVLSQRPNPAMLIADEDNYSVWYKPYGMLSQGSKWSDHCTITRWAQKNLLPERAVFSVHRLDRAASGLIIIAHTKKAAQAFSKMFEQHQLEKTYHIIVYGNQLARIQPETVKLEIEGKRACSHFSTIEHDKARDLSLLEVKIESGRKHQIRIHATSIGLPVVGDRLHGDKNLNKLNENFKEDVDLQLCAVQLIFNCPFKNTEQVFTLPNTLCPQLNNLK